MTPALAEGILPLDFPKNVRANQGHLTDDEQAELDASSVNDPCMNVGDLLACWQSKARQVVQPQAALILPGTSGDAPVIVVSTTVCRNRLEIHFFGFLASWRLCETQF